MAELFDLFITFFKIGLFTFGGGYAMIPLIQEEVIKNQWLDSVETLVDFIAISESTPGPFAVNIATFIGYHEAGVIGALFATLGVVLPSFIIILLIARFFHHFQTNRYVKGFLKGVKPVIVGILATVALAFVLRSTIHTDIMHLPDWIVDVRALIIFAGLFIIYRVFNRLNPIYLILISAVFGLVAYGLF
ncbi:MAG: chromate transporter [Bacilli bacterium]|nr:chromate transporter [Bacilli bacterium]MBN2695975.1 chromate transporter [Bacilli bacterium]